MVLVDIGLPGKFGIEGIRLLKGRYPLVMVVLTVFDDDRRVFEALCAGASGMRRIFDRLYVPTKSETVAKALRNQIIV